jgi:hypothetical protein
MSYLTRIMLLAFWIVSAHAGMASEPPLRILYGSRSQDGLFHLQIAASNTLAYEVQTSTNLLQWIPLQTNLATGNLAEFVDTNAKSFRQRYYRLTDHKNGLALSTSSANPGERLVISGGPFDPSARTLVRFLDTTGVAVSVRSFTVTTGSVVVAVPFMVNTSAPQVRGGMVKVSLGQETAAATNVFASDQQLQIADLPATGLTPGAVTLEYLNQISNLLATASSRWQTIGMASQGKVDTAALRRDLLSMQTNVVAAQKMIQSLISGQTSRITLGRIHDRDVILDMDAVASLDRMLVASLNYHSGSTLLARKSISTLENATLLAGISDAFNPGASSESTFNMFDQFNSIGGLGVGLLATTAVVLGIATAPAAAAVAGTAGAVLFFSTYVAPAVMGASAMALAAPFIEVQTGKQITLEDYRPALNHIEKGSQAYLYDELQGNLLNGVFQSQGASADLMAQSSIFVSTSKSVLDNLDLTKPQSVGSLAFANSETIFAGLRPASDLVKYSANITTTFDDTYPDAAWEDKLTGTITISVRGQGTTPAPFSGTFLFDGTILETLLYCHSVDAPCDPGGTYLLKLTDGVVAGSFGLVTADGTGTLTTAAGASPFPFQFTAGVINGTTLTGTLVLGDCQEMVVTLNRQ